MTGSRAVLDPDPRLRRFLAAWNAHDVQRIVGLFTPDATIDDEFVIIDPDRPAGRRRYRGHDGIRGFASVASPGFRAELVGSTTAAGLIRFTALVSADALRRRGIEAIEQHDELTYEGELVRHFRIGYPAASKARLREAAARHGSAGESVHPAGHQPR
jgi:hypothetical protein